MNVDPVAQRYTEQTARSIFVASLGPAQGDFQPSGVVVEREEFALGRIVIGFGNAQNSMIPRQLDAQRPALSLFVDPVAVEVGHQVAEAIDVDHMPRQNPAFGL